VQSLESVVIAKERSAIVFSRQHRMAGVSNVALKDFLDDTFFVPRQEDEEGIHNTILTNLSRSGGLPSQLQTVERVQTAICLAAANLGVALVPESAKAMRMQHTIFRTLRGMALPIETYAVWRRDDSSPIVAAVQQLLRHAAVDRAAARRRQ